MDRSRWIAGLAGCVLCMSTLTIAADDPPAKAAEKTRTVKSPGVQFDVPESWKSSTPTSQMRKAQIRVEPAEGDKDPAELVLFVFPGGAGGVEANVERWQRQFAEGGGDAPDVESTKIKVGDREVTRVEVAGTYTDPFSGGGSRPNYRLYGAILTTDDSGYFFKMVGPERTMKQAKAGFDQMIKSIKLTD